jgi:heme exporter protein B
VTAPAGGSLLESVRPRQALRPAGFWRSALTVALKDLRAELRTKQALNASLAFSVVILLLFSFAFDPTAEETRALAGGLLWLVFAFAGALIWNRSFARELPNDCLDGLLAAPISGAALYAGKAAANWLLLMAVELAGLAAFGVFYNAAWTSRFWPLLGVLALGTWAVTVVGTLFSALTVNLRLRELMLPLLVYPLLIPALLAAIQLTGPLAVGQAASAEAMLWLRLLGAFDIIFTALALGLVEAVLVS